MSNFTPGSGVRDVSVSDSGNDLLNGRNTLFAKRTLGGAASATADLNPEPSLTSPAAIVDGGASRYVLSESFSIPNNVQCAIQYSSVAASFAGFSGAAMITAADNSQTSMLTISTNADSGLTAYSSDGKSRTSLDARAVIMNGVNQTGVSLDGATDQAFLNLGQVLARFSGSIGVDVTSTGNSPRYYQANEINVAGDNCIGFNYDTPASGAAAFRVGAITYEDNPLTPDTGAGCAAINVKNGTLAGYAAELEAERVINVDAGGDLIIDNLLSIGGITNSGKANITSRRLAGDIVNSGFLTVRVDEHVSGDVINSGILNGEINGVRYGSWASDDGSEQSRTFTMSGNVSSSAQIIGYMTIDTTTDSIDTITSTYFQTNSGSRQYNIAIADQDNGTEYFGESNISSGFGFKNFDALKVVNAMPVNQVVNLVILQSRTGAGGLNTGQCIIEFTRS